jgi:hypothetical protein
LLPAGKGQGSAVLQSDQIGFGQHMSVQPRVKQAVIEGAKGDLILHAIGEELVRRNLE